MSTAKEKKPELRTKEVRLSARNTVILREMNAFDSMIADEYLGESANQTRAYKTYAIAAVQRLNSVEVLPLKSESQFRKLARLFSLPETNVLVAAFMAFTREIADANDQKIRPARRRPPSSGRHRGRGDRFHPLRARDPHALR